MDTKFTAFTWIATLSLLRLDEKVIEEQIEEAGFVVDFILFLFFGVRRHIDLFSPS